MIARALKSCVYGLSEHLGLNACSRFALRSRLLVLCYHGVVSDDTPNDRRTRTAVTRSQFDFQLRELGRHWTPISIHEVLEACYHGSRLPRNAVLITFDDGFCNNLTLAAPLLRHYGFPAVFFVTTGHIGTTNLLWTQEVVERVCTWPESCVPVPAPHGQTRPLPVVFQHRVEIASDIVADCKRLPNEQRLDYLQRLNKHAIPPLSPWQHELYDFADWEEVRELVRQGFDVGAHTVDHPILTSLCYEDLDCQLSQSRQTIETELGRPCPWIAYPNGSYHDFDGAILEAVHRCGYQLGFTLCETRNTIPINALAIDRLCIARDTDSGLFRARLAGLR